MRVRELSRWSRAHVLGIKEYIFDLRLTNVLNNHDATFKDDGQHRIFYTFDMQIFTDIGRLQLRILNYLGIVRLTSNIPIYKYVFV